MSPNSQEIHEGGDGGGELQISPELQTYISHDTRLQWLAKDPENLRVISRVFQENKDIFSRVDVPAEHMRLWSESLKENGQMTQDGRKFFDLKPEDVKKLSDVDYDVYQEWKIANKQATVNQIDGRIGDKSATVNQNAEIVRNKERIDVTVKTLRDKLTVNDNKLVDSELAKAKSGGDNAAVTELKQQGATQADIQSGKYDSYISASIIIENAGKFEAARDPAFQASIRELQSLGIPVRVQPDFQAISQHMDERFQSGERLDIAKSAVRDGLTSGGYTSVHYDGIGERYTLIGKDGETKKEITLDKPPISRIRYGDISLERETPKVDENDQKRKGLIEAYKKNGDEVGRLVMSPTPSETTEENDKIRDLYTKALSRSFTVETRMEAVKNLQENISTRKGELENTPKTDIEMDKLIEMGGTVGKLKEEQYTLRKLSVLYEAEQRIVEQSKKIPPPKMDTWDTDARDSLMLYNSLGLGKLGQAGFEDFIEAWNFHYTNQKAYSLNRDTNPKIDESQEAALRTFISEKLQSDGTTPQEKFQNLRNKLTDENFMSEYWNTPGKRAQYLFGN